MRIRSKGNFGFFVRHAVARGFIFRNGLLILKRTPLPSFSKKNWRSAFENCMYLVKEGATPVFNFLSQKEMQNVYPHRSSEKLTDHPTEKPLGMIRRIIEVSSNPGDLVLDPFMGSGTTALACVQAGRRFVGFDKEPAYIQMAEARLKGAAKEPA
ncbi:MAG: site-specific DNA-methyltransferase [Phycisphaerales bacterium]